MGTLSAALDWVNGYSYPLIMSRPRFTPDEKQDRLLTVLKRLGEQQRTLTRETDSVIAEANAARIPITYIAEALERPRKTIYRHLGRKMP